MNNKVSVIVPFYNVAQEYFQCCMQSLLNQTYKNIEIIVINDGSSDEFAKILNEYKSLSNVAIISKDNGGVASA